MNIEKCSRIFHYKRFIFTRVPSILIELLTRMRSHDWDSPLFKDVRELR